MQQCPEKLTAGRRVGSLVCHRPHRSRVFTVFRYIRFCLRISEIRLQRQGPAITMDMIHAGNAKHAQEFANCTKAETIALHKKNAAEAAAIVRGLSDAELDNKGVVLQGMPPMSAGDLAGGLMVGHIDEHLNSIRAAVGQ